MIKLGILATAREKNGGTLSYTISMIQALSLLPSETYSLIIYTQRGNKCYESLGIKVLYLNHWEFFKNAFNKCDLIISPVYSIKLLFLSKPYIFTLHDLQERYFPKNFFVATRLWRKFINYFLSKRAVAIICESSYVKRDIIKFIGIDASKIFVFPAPPQLSILNYKAPTDNSKELPKHYVFYPAQFWPHKNHLCLLEAFLIVHKKFPHYYLVLSGKHAFDFHKVKAKVSKLGLEDYVIFLGYLPQVQMSSVYAKSTLMVMPTLFESISIPIYEAFALGVPVCCSAVVALPEQIGDAGLLFDPLDPDDIANKMIELLTSQKLREDLVIKGKKLLSDMTIAGYSSRLRGLIDLAAI